MSTEFTSKDLLITLRSFMNNQFNGFDASQKNLSYHQKFAFTKACVFLIKQGWTQPEKYWSKLDLNDESKDFFDNVLKHIFNYPKKVFNKELSNDTRVFIEFFTKLNLFNHVLHTLEDSELRNLLIADNEITVDWFLKMHTDFEQDFKSFTKKYSNDNALINEAHSICIYRLKKIFLGSILSIVMTYLAKTIVKLLNLNLRLEILIILTGLVATQLPIFLLDNFNPNSNVGHVFTDSTIKTFFFIPRDNLLKIIDNYVSRNNSNCKS